PAWNASRTDPAGPLKEGAATSTGRTHTRFRWLIIAELATAMTLLMSTSLMLKSVRLMEHYDFGYPHERLSTVYVGAPFRGDSITPAESEARKEQAVATMRATPGVEAFVPDVRTANCGLENYTIVSDRTVE